jgi:hypothetical protein
MVPRISEHNTLGMDGENFLPSEGSLVDLGKCKSSSLVGIQDVGEIIVKVVESCITTRRLVGERVDLLVGHC